MTDSPRIESLCVLVVEDQEFQRSMLVRMVARLGAGPVLEASDGAAALLVLQRMQPRVDVVVSDLDMPGMDGFEFIRRLAGIAQPPAVIVMSAIDSALLASVEALARAYGVRLLGALPKPLAQQRLRQLLGDAGAVFKADAEPEAERDMPTVDEIRAGLAAGEFEPWFQPKVELANRRVVGFEALARWRRPDGELLPPRCFLPAMEEGGLIGTLTEVMLAKAAACCNVWRANGLEATVAVNVSVSSLADVATADRLTAAVVAQGLPPRHVILEITESAAANDALGAVLENLARLRLRGFGLAIDDFGTGYSSVQQLGRIAFTELKIDRSFVRGAANHEPTLIIVRASLRMARELKLVAVAEGVESARDWQLLQGLGCDLAQGYFIARPMEAAQVEAWVREWNARETLEWPEE